jgi:ABC-type glycerol-3-phosphate transport system substrate-binding protein
MKTLLAVLLAALLLGACAHGGADSSGAGTGSITMYGTIDEGVTVHK